MFNARRSSSFLLILGALVLTGCHSTHGKSVPANPSAAAAEVPAPGIGRHFPRESAFSVYHNPAYGISFHYPRTYLLDESSDSENSAIAEAQQVLATDQPGAVLVVLVSIPPDAYPNTTFAGGTFQFVVNPELSPAACHSLAAPSADALTFGSTSVQGLPLAWVQTSSVALGTVNLNRDYAGFSNATCYEFLLQVVTGSHPEQDAGIKPADELKIMRQLAKIISSIQFKKTPKQQAQ